MARTRLTDTSTDAVSDSGGVLWSFIQGEQLEYPIELTFIEDVNRSNYIIEAVLAEGENDGTGTKPIDIKASSPVIHSNGVEGGISLRTLSYDNAWVSGNSYNRDTYVQYGTDDNGDATYYRALENITALTTAPDQNIEWELYNTSTIFVRFHSVLSTGWSPQADIEKPVYGFFELRITEPTGEFPRTWKPVRGLMEFLFSPTLTH